MSDPRCDRLAELVLGYSLALQPGEILRIDGHEQGKPLLLALYRAALACGAHPYIRTRHDETEDILLAHGSDEQLDWVSPLDRQEVDFADAVVTLFNEGNTRRHTHVDPARHGRHIAARRTLSTALWQRIESGATRWCGTHFPTASGAQEAGLPLSAYEDFVYRACHVDGDADPVAYWRAYADDLRRRAASLDGVGELRLLGDGTDLTLGLEGRTWLTGDGSMNMPDGEIFTSPVETMTRGEVTFAYPALFTGREVRGIRLGFDAGRVVQAEAQEGEEYLQTLLALDAGASVLGEAAIGLNYGVDRFTNNTLFDEKIGGTIHLALGHGFASAGGVNESDLHWDVVCDLGPEGEIHADGEVIWRGGRFLAEI